MSLMSIKVKEHFWQLLTLGVSGLMFLVWAYHIPFNNAPDELMRYQIPQFIFKHGKLPTGYDKEVIYDLGNWSYGFFAQFLGSILSSFYMAIMSLFKNSDHALLFAARLASVTFGIIAVWFTGKSIEIVTKSKKMAVMGMFFLAFLPQFTFLSSYVNNDITAVAGVSIIIYSLLKANLKSWTIKTSILLSIGFIICGLGYLNSYGFILMGGIFFVISHIMDYRSGKITAKQVRINIITAIILTCLVVIPFYIRNYLLYNDFLGMKTFTNEYLKWIAAGGQVLLRAYPGNLIDLLTDLNYLRSVFHSFVGQFGYMSVIMDDLYYRFYLYTGIIGTLGFVLRFIYEKQKRVLDLGKILLICSIFLSCLITISLHIYYSLTHDYQPQGRYIMAIVVPLIIVVTYGFQYIVKNYIVYQKEKIVVAVLCLLFLYVNYNIYITYIV
ncbi:phospholipid carrier-dependent glycosyltransferase [Paenibacillus wenxiniae]|uniref:Phospholipid carrier-dependent glycosyltransferase n=1 Tax=Paenibacillus wenxiniae TaxID=1636843 RepID=A0ABW4RH97_9BACL